MNIEIVSEQSDTIKFALERGGSEKEFIDLVAYLPTGQRVVLLFIADDLRVIPYAHSSVDAKKLEALGFRLDSYKLRVTDGV